MPQLPASRLLLWRAAAIAAVVALWAQVPVARAATPSSGTIGPTSPTVSWQGQSYAVAATPVPEACPQPDPANTICDHFSLTVDVPPSYWDANTGGAEIVITWQSPDDDFDLYVYDAAGNLVGSSASGGTTSERVFVQSANSGAGPYEVRVVPFLVQDSGYSGRASFVSVPGGPTPNPTRSTGGLAFGPQTVIDPQRTEGEPINHLDTAGNYWESGPWGTSTQQSFVHRSTDGGDSFHIVSPIGLRPDAPPGGGDTDVATDDQGTAYFVDLEGLVNLGVAVSNDDGNTWRKNPLTVTQTVDDRQWLAVDSGTSRGAGDNTVFLAFRQVPLGSFIYSSPGSTGPSDPTGGLVYTDSSDTPGLPIASGAPCGQLKFDPVQRNLYYPCAAGNHVQVTVGHVNVGQRTGIHYRTVDVPASPGGGPVGDIFPVVTTDAAGTVYAVWIDETNHDVYYSFSTDQGSSWSAPVQVNGNDANSNVFPWAAAGAPGRLAVVWYGSPSHLDSDLMPSWYNDRQAATAFPWFGYAALVTNAASSSPSFAQQRFTHKPMHYGQICTGGLGCTTSNGDRTMADFFALTLDRKDGAMRIVFDDTTSQHHGAHLFEVRQVAGPSAAGGTVSRSVPTNPVSDPAGDAQWPHYGPTGPGANLPQLDLRSLRLSQPTAGTLRVQMTVADLSSLAPPPGKTRALWLTRFQALSMGDENEEAYRLFYVGAESTGGGPLTFFAGSGTSNDNGVPGNGCVNTTPENCKVVEYPAEVSATGSVSGNTITIDVPIQGGFGPGRPILSPTLFSVTALTAGRNDAVTDLYADVDATPAFDLTLSTLKPPPPGKGRKVTGGGAIPGKVPTVDARFALNVLDRPGGKVEYVDPSPSVGADFRSTQIQSVTFDDATGAATIKGIGVNGDHQVGFTVRVIDAGEPGTADRFEIALTDGYANGGTLRRGNIQIH